MQFPPIIILQGQDIINVIEILSQWNVKYIIYPNYELINESSKLLINKFQWETNLIYIETDYYRLKHIKDGVKRILFSNEHNKLVNLTVKDWTCETWQLDMTNSVIDWFLIDPVILPEIEKLSMAYMFESCIDNDKQILTKYKEILLPIFQHPDIQRMLKWCISRKESHLKMWNTAKINLKLPTFDMSQYIAPQIILPTTLYQVVDELIKMILIEEPLSTPVSECLAYYSSHNYICELFTAVKRRNIESCKNGKELQNLLDEIEMFYPFLSKPIFEAFDKHINIVNVNITNFFRANFQLFNL